MSSVDLDAMPPHILLFCLHMKRYSFNICHAPSKLLYAADILSTVPIASKYVVDEAENLESAIEAFIAASTSHLPATSTQLEQFRKAQSEGKPYRMFS